MWRGEFETLWGLETKLGQELDLAYTSMGLKSGLRILQAKELGTESSVGQLKLRSCDQKLKVMSYWGIWVAQLVKCLTLEFGSGHDLMVRGFKPCVRLCGDREVVPAWDSLSPSLSAPPPLVLSK